MGQIGVGPVEEKSLPSHDLHVVLPQVAVLERGGQVKSLEPRHPPLEFQLEPAQALDLLACKKLARSWAVQGKIVVQQGVKLFGEALEWTLWDAERAQVLEIRNTSNLQLGVVTQSLLHGLERGLCVQRRTLEFGEQRPAP